MRLVYKKSGREVAVGQQVRLDDGVVFEVTHFKPPHKPSSSGKVSVRRIGEKTSSEYYVHVIGAEWIEREDRDFFSMREGQESTLTHQDMLDAIEGKETT